MAVPISAAVEGERSYYRNNGNENDAADHFILLDVALELDRYNGAPPCWRRRAV